jgi:hypothetical protein
MVRQDGRVDAAREISNVPQGIGRVGLELGQQPGRLVRVAGRELLGQPELDRQGHELLLCAVVDVALEFARPLVLRGDDAPSRLLELLDQAHVAHHEPGLAREVGHELLAVLREWLGGGHGDGERAQELAAIANRERPAPFERRELVGSGPDRLA